jgi:hypothetical protein
MRRVLRGFLLFLQCRPVQFAIPLIAVLALFPCCGGSPFGPGGDDTPRVTITGTIASGASTRRAVHGSSAQLDLSDARRVLVFSFSNYQLADIVDGSFSVRAETGTATALIFLGAGDQYIGNLYAGGLNVLPLSNLRDEENIVIDLETLTQDSTSVIPSHDPIGDEIDISAEEVARLREMGAFFESLAQNIDADDDGVPDLLQGRRLTLTSSFSVFGGQWGQDDTLPMVFDTARMVECMNYSVRIEGPIAMAVADPGTVALSGPAGGEYDDIVTMRYVAEMDCFITFFARPAEAQPDVPWGSALLPFAKGIYSFTLNGSDHYNLSYSSIDAKYHMVVAIPTLHTGTSGEIVSVSLDYRLPDGTPVDPATFITCLQLQFGRNDDTRVEIGSLYERVKTNRTIEQLTSVPVGESIQVSALRSLSVNYNDVLGNEYNIIWR